MATPLAQPQQATPATAQAVSDDVQRFIDANRIHIQHGSLFLDPYLVVHPRELKPENADALKAKLSLTFGLNNPSFYESYDRLPVALNLATLLPRQLGPWRAGLMRAIDEFNLAVKTGRDPQLDALAEERAHPFQAIVNQTLKAPDSDPMGMETLKGGLTFYLLLREALTRKGHLNSMTSYVRHDQTADQILTSLQDKIGITAEVITEAARTGGLAGVGKALGLDDAYLREVQDVVDKAATKEFSYNLIEHWHIGRQLLAGKNASIDDKISVGFERRLLDTMTQLKAKAKGQTDVPDSVKSREQWVADGLKLLPPIQRQLLWDLGYEIGYTDDVTADKIAFHPHIYGLHRTTKDGMNDVRGTYRIYFAGKGDQELSRRTLVHEVTHNLWPSLFSEADVQQIDALANRDRLNLQTKATVLDAQFETFKGFVDAYHKAGATAEQKQQVLSQANTHFSSTLGDVSALIAENKDAYEVLHMTQHANERLHVDGKLYKQSGYHGPQERFREVISRFAELRYVRLREQPALLEFVAPGLRQMYDQQYLPHLERLHAEIVARQQTMAQPAAPQGTAVAAANDNQTEQGKLPPQPEEGATREQPKVEVRVNQPVPTAKTKDAADAAMPDDASKSEKPSTVLMGGNAAAAERYVAAMQTLSDMGVHPR